MRLEVKGQVWCSWAPNEWSVTLYAKQILFSCYGMILIIFDL